MFISVVKNFCYEEVDKVKIIWHNNIDLLQNTDGSYCLTPGHATGAGFKHIYMYFEVHIVINTAVSIILAADVRNFKSIPYHMEKQLTSEPVFTLKYQ